MDVSPHKTSPARSPRRWRAAITLTAALVAGGLATAASPASAAVTDCTSTHQAAGHCYDVTWATGLGHSPYAGGHLTLTQSLLVAGPSSAAAEYHINNEMWVGLDGHHYIEAGVRDGFIQSPGDHCASFSAGVCTTWEDVAYEPGSGASQACLVSGCGAYVLFWADTTYDPSTGTTWQYEHVVSFTSPDNTTENIDILFNGDGSGHWNVYFSGRTSYSGRSTIEDQWQRPADVEWGGEVYAPAGNGYCADVSEDQAGLWSTTGNGDYTLSYPANTAAVTTVSPGFVYWTAGLIDGNNWAWDVNDPC